MTVGVFDHPWLGGLFDSEGTADLFSAENQLNYFLEIEASYALALGEAGAVPLPVAEEAARYIRGFRPDEDSLNAGSSRDGMVIPDFIRQLKAAADKKLHPAIHQGLTSQDVIDTALTLTLREANKIMTLNLKGLILLLDELNKTQGGNRLMGRTRMQAAKEIRVGHRIENWLEPLRRQKENLGRVFQGVEVIQFGGPVGDRQETAAFAEKIAVSLARRLGLGNPEKSWHTSRGNLTEYASALSVLTGSLGKMGQDFCLMAQQGPDEIQFKGGGSSSAMAHKQNPVNAELLVTLARFNAVQVSGMHQAMIHEQERSGTAWTLEWMILPQIVTTTAVALTKAQSAINQITRIGIQP